MVVLDTSKIRNVHNDYRIYWTSYVSLYIAVSNFEQKCAFSQIPSPVGDARSVFKRSKVGLEPQFSFS